MTQTDVFTLPPPKAVADTSIDAYRQLVQSLPSRELAVLNALRAQAEPPSAYELFQWMAARGIVFDLNSVRPRLTELQERHYVERAAKRRCRVTGRTVYTWKAAI